MKSYLKALKELYQVALYDRDAKISFFHGNDNLINTKNIILCIENAAMPE